jgi:hypothetical protein
VHPDRVCYVEIAAKSSLLGKVATVMQEPFPALTLLRLSSNDGDVPALPSEFLGGSAPRLQEICLDGIPFLTLPTLLFSTSDLVVLNLDNIPITGYISPEAMITCLTTLTRLRSLSNGFRAPTSHSDQMITRPSPQTRVVLPALTFFDFRGISEYLKDLFFIFYFTYIPGHVTKTKTGRNQRIDRSVQNPTVHTPYAPQASSWNHPYGGPIRPMFC